MTVKIELFTSPTCPHCPSAKNLTYQVGKEVEGVKVVETSTATKQGSKRARSMDVMSVPTIFVTGPEFERIGFRGTPSKSRLLDAIAISNGEKKWEEPKSFMEKLKEKIPIKIKF
ncbi:MAG: glutaredoxin domain-containing protein [archaeon]